MTAPDDLRLHLEGYRRAVTALVHALRPMGRAGDALAGGVVRCWRHHVELCLERIVAMDRFVAHDAVMPLRPPLATLDELWPEARPVLVQLGRSVVPDVVAADLAVRRLAAADAAGGREAQGPASEEFHDTMMALSRCLERALRRLARLSDRKVEALAWIA